MRQAFELYATGYYSMRALAGRLAKEGLIASNGKPIPQAHIRNFLTNPFYMGRVRWHELDVPGKHPPLVTPTLFEKVQSTIRGRYRHPGVKGGIDGFPLRGLGICATCRGHMTAERHGRWSYYRCSRQTFQKELCRARFCNADKAHTAVEALCRRVRLARATADKIQQAADRLIRERVISQEERMATLTTERDSFIDKETKLTESFMASDISSKVYQAAAAKLRQEQTRIEADLSRVNVDADQLRGRVQETLRLATSLSDLYEMLNDVRRAELLRAVFSVVVLGPEGVVGFTLKPPFDELVKPQHPHETGGDHAHLAEVILDAA